MNVLVRHRGVLQRAQCSCRCAVFRTAAAALQRPRKAARTAHSSRSNKTLLLSVLLLQVTFSFASAARPVRWISAKSSTVCTLDVRLRETPTSPQHGHPAAPASVVIRTAAATGGVTVSAARRDTASAPKPTPDTLQAAALTAAANPPAAAAKAAARIEYDAAAVRAPGHAAAARGTAARAGLHAGASRLERRRHSTIYASLLPCRRSSSVAPRSSSRPLVAYLVLQLATTSPPSSSACGPEHRSYCNCCCCCSSPPCAFLLRRAAAPAAPTTTAATAAGGAPARCTGAVDLPLLAAGGGGGAATAREAPVPTAAAVWWRSGPAVVAAPTAAALPLAAAASFSEAAPPGCAAAAAAVACGLHAAPDSRVAYRGGPAAPAQELIATAAISPAAVAGEHLAATTCNTSALAATTARSSTDGARQSVAAAFAGAPGVAALNEAATGLMIRTIAQKQLQQTPAVPSGAASTRAFASTVAAAAALIDEMMPRMRSRGAACAGGGDTLSAAKHTTSSCYSPAETGMEGTAAFACPEQLLTLQQRAAAAAWSCQFPTLFTQKPPHTAAAAAAASSHPAAEAAATRATETGVLYDYATVALPPAASFPLFPSPSPPPHVAAGGATADEAAASAATAVAAAEEDAGSRRREAESGGRRALLSPVATGAAAARAAGLGGTAERRGRKLLEAVVSPAQQKLLQLRDGKDRSGEFFVAQLGGKQLLMQRGRFYDVNRIHQREGGRITLHRLLCVRRSDGDFWLGRPYLENAKAIARVEKHFSSPKKFMAKARPKKWRKYFSHRQQLTRILIEDLLLCTRWQEEATAEATTAALPLNSTRPDGAAAADGEAAAGAAPVNGEQRKQGWKVYTTEDPVYAALMNCRLSEKPSRWLPRLKQECMQLATRKRLPLLGRDPLQNFDPLANQVVFDALCRGENEMLPGLRPADTC